MMMSKNRSRIGRLFLFISGLLFTGCKKDTVQFIVSSDEEGVICSAKSTFNDTIFYENRFPDTTVYYYATLSEYENKELKNSIIKLSSEKSMPKFELRPGSGTFVVESNDVKFYEANYSIPSRNIKRILALFRDKGSAMKICNTVKGFWNIDGVEAPDNPVP